MNRTIIVRKMSDNSLSKGQHFPDFKHRDHLSLEALTERISSMCTITPHDIKGCLSALCAVVGEAIGQGYTVSLGELGSLRAQVRCADDTDTPLTQRNASGFAIGRITFAPAQPLRVAANTAFQRVAKRQRGVVVPSTRHSTPAQRLALLQAHLRQHRYISASTYAALTRLSISTAQRELRRWQDAPNNHIGYTLIAGRRHTIWQP